MTDTVLLDTAERYHAWNTGRDGPEPYARGGLRIVYDPGVAHPTMLATGLVRDYRTPSVILNGPDGEVALTGIAEIKAANTAIAEGLELAQRAAPRSLK